MKIKKEQRQKEQNRKYKTLIKNSFKDIEKIVLSKSSDDNNNFENLEKASRHAQKVVDKAARKGLIHKKNASRKVRRIFGIVNSFKERNFSS